MCEIEGEGRAPNVYPALRIARALLTELADGVDPFAPVSFPAREDAARVLGKTEEEA